MRQYQQVTDRIITMLEAGTRPWSQPCNVFRAASFAEKACDMLHGFQVDQAAAV